MSTAAQSYIDAFRRGEDFNAPAVGLTVQGQPDPAALKFLGEQLAVASSPVREKIVKLLVDLGRRTDPLTPQGADVLRNPQILAILAGPGLVKPDLGRQAAIDSLRRFSLPGDLSPFGDALTKVLQEFPTEDCFLLVAKAKPQEAKGIVNHLAESSAWSKTEAPRIAQAALGDTKIESEFLSAVAKADANSNARALATALATLGLIGTPTSLRAIAQHLRTPLTIELKGAFVKSVRIDVLEALLYNFPDQPVLYPNKIVVPEDYLAAEQFCSRTLGVAYTTPEPPFLTYQGYPIPVPQ